MTTPPPPGPKFRREPDDTIVRIDPDGTVTRFPPDARERERQRRRAQPRKITLMSLVPWWTITGVLVFIVAAGIIGG